MNSSLFREGGPYRIQKTGPDLYTFNITLPTDEYGRAARKCPSKLCSPGYFKIKPGTGITGEQQIAYCPYCRHRDEPDNFATDEQRRFAEDVMLREAHKGIQNKIGSALGVSRSGSKKIGNGPLSIELKYNPGQLPHVRRPFEEEIQRAVICPHCGLDHAVFGIAVWCSDCGKDIFTTHVQAELAVVAVMLADVDRRRTELGPRVAARDLENCLEDTVSIFEAVLKALTIRHLRAKNRSDEEIQSYLKRIGTSFQSLDRTVVLLSSEFSINIQQEVHSDSILRLKSTFDKRHPITHNLGVVDRKYIERSLTAAAEGREIRVTKEEIEFAIKEAQEVLAKIHSRLIGEFGDREIGDTH